jgi:hypothetical protein
MPTTYDPIATQTLGTTSSLVTFDSIPQTYTDLILVTAGTATSFQQVCLRFNNVTTTANYSSTILSGTGSAVLSIRYSGLSYMFFGYDAYFTTSQANAISQIMNYSNTTTFKTVLDRSNNAATGVGLSVGLSRSTSAVTRIDVIPNAGSWASGTSFTLYGIKAA